MRRVARPAALFGVAAAAGMAALQPGYPRHAGGRPWGHWSAASAAKTAARNPAAAAAPGSAGLALLPAMDGRRPTFVLFLSEGSLLERQFLAGLRRDNRARNDLRVVLLPSLESPIARRFALHESPTLLALGPGGREISRHVGPETITAALPAPSPRLPAPGSQPSTSEAGSRELGAGSCRIWRGPRLRWVEESDPRARRVYRRFGGRRREVPDIFKAMSLRPDLMDKVLDLSEMGHFSDGYLDRKTKQQIATYVSALNGSHYCVGSHAAGLRDLGARPSQVAALAGGDLDGASLAPRQRVLFEFIRQLTLKPGEITDADVKRLKAAGWRDEQIFEAAFDASLFALFNRIAVTYGLEYPPDGWIPPTQSAPEVAHRAMEPLGTTSAVAR